MGMGAARVTQRGDLWAVAVPKDSVLGVVHAQLMGTLTITLSLPGFVVGHAGLYQALIMFVVAYFIIGMTVLSVCAIATNGALDAGGAYCILCCGAAGTGQVGQNRVMTQWPWEEGVVWAADVFP